MVPGRHAQRTGLLSRLWPRRRQRARAALQADVKRTRALAEAAAVAASAALQRASTAADVAVMAELRAVRAEMELASARRQAAALRAEVVALREEVVWAFAARRADAASPAPVIDLRRQGAG